MTVDEISPIHYLGDYAASLTANNIPADVRRQALLCILDTVGCIIAGTIAEEPQAMRRAEKLLAGNTSVQGESTVIGTDDKLSPTSAARCNAFAGDQFELNDLLGGHASIGCVNALLTVAEKVNASGLSKIFSSPHKIVQFRVAFHRGRSRYGDCCSFRSHDEAFPIDVLGSKALQ